MKTGRPAALLLSLLLPAVACPQEAAENAQAARATFRCTKLAELASCDEALDMRPDDATLLVAEADALVLLERPGEAIGVYRNALTRVPDQQAVVDKIATAEAQRQRLLDTCETQMGEAARRACVSARLPGAPDEAELFVRRGLLLELDNQLPAALDAYMAAARLRPHDPAIAQSVVTLCNSTGGREPITLTAKGAALNALGRYSEALSPLRQALTLAPDLAAAKTQLLIAEQAPPAEAPVRRAKVSHPPAPPRFSNDAPDTRTN